MKIYPLHASRALSPGSEAWIIPEINKSSWVPKLNWFINLQLTLVNQRKQRTFEEPLLEIIKEEELSFPELKPEKSGPLLIAVGELLPTRYLIQIPMLSSRDAWLKEAVEVAESLKVNSVRFFLPKNISSDDIRKDLSKKISFLTVVNDSITG